MITYAERACFREAQLHLLSCVEMCIARVSNAWGNDLRCLTVEVRSVAALWITCACLWIVRRR